MFDTIETNLRTETDKSQRQAEEIKKLEMQLREKSKAQTATVPQGGKKRDKLIEEKDAEIKKLEELLKTTRDFRNLSRVALEHRDRELETLREKHGLLLRAAKNATSRWRGMGELAEAVENAE